jgi:L-alanine-DL-glutamate epimerase-like enolase superfamily enzyme
MKVTDVKVSILNVPLDPPVKAAHLAIPSAHLIVTELATDISITGIGFGAVLRAQFARPLAQLVEGLRDVVVGLDITHPDVAGNRLRSFAFKAGPGGMATWAVSAIEVGLWDAYAKVHQEPLYRVLGGTNPRVPAYCIRGLTNDTLHGLISELNDVLDEGWRHVKIHIPGIIGDGTPDAVADNFRAIHRQCSDNRPSSPPRLALDNQNIWSIPDAIRLGQKLQDLGLFWFEEPIDFADTAGLARVNSALEVPVCTGEQRFGLAEFRPLLEERSADVIMADVRMTGGITPFKKLAAACEMWNTRITSHMMTAIDAHIMAAVANTMPIEYVPWTDQVFDQPLFVQEGEVVLSDRPGLGCELQPRVKERLGA